MQTLSKRDRTLLILMIVVVIGALALVLAPSGKAGATSRNQLPLEEARHKNIAAKVQLKQLATEQTLLKPQIARLTYNMPAEQLTAYVTEDLYKLADRAGVHIREIKPLRSRTLPDGSVARVPVEVRFRAPFQPNVMRFLYFTEDPAHKMVVDKINITSSDTRLKSVDVDAQITVYTRYVAGSSTTGAGQGDANDSPDTTNSG